MFKISELRAGVSFGELALVNNKPRSATIIAVEDTWCAMLLKGPFEAILKKLERDKMNVLIAGLDRFLTFKTLTRIYKIKLFKGIDTVEFTRGQILYDEGDKANAIYFLLEGEYEIFK